MTLTTRLLLGEKVDALEHARMVSTLVELAALIDKLQRGPDRGRPSLET